MFQLELESQAIFFPLWHSLSHATLAIIGDFINSVGFGLILRGGDGDLVVRSILAQIINHGARGRIHAGQLEGEVFGVCSYCIVWGTERNVYRR